MTPGEVGIPAMSDIETARQIAPLLPAVDADVAAMLRRWLDALNARLEAAGIAPVVG